MLGKLCWNHRLLKFAAQLGYKLFQLCVFGVQFSDAFFEALNMITEKRQALLEDGCAAMLIDKTLNVTKEAHSSNENKLSHRSGSGAGLRLK
jgi:hypothetical protein